MCSNSSTVRLDVLTFTLYPAYLATADPDRVYSRVASALAWLLKACAVANDVSS